jgi:ribonuclease P protein component
VPKAAIVWVSERDRSGSAMVLKVPINVDSPELSRSFRPAYRLCKTDEYSSVFAFRKAVKGRFFVLHYKPSSLVTSRFGVVVAKKLVRRAVQRNLIKRLARDIFRNVRATLGMHDLILRVHSTVASASRSDLREDMQLLFRRLPR